jgi:hypothetical protein
MQMKIWSGNQKIIKIYLRIGGNLADKKHKQLLVKAII